MDMLVKSNRFSSWPLAALLVVGVLLLGSPSLSAQGQFEEIAVGFQIPQVMDQDLLVQYDGEFIYVGLIELFTRLDIHIEADYANRLFYGQYYVNDKNYRIDLIKLQATALGKKTSLNREEFYLGETDLYLRLDLYPRIFDLDMKFDFGTLKIALTLDENFPAYRRLLREEAHRLLELKKPKTTGFQAMALSREYVNGAVLDWTLSTSPIGTNKIHYMDLHLGGMVLGGDMAVSATGNSQRGLQSDQSTFRWHYYVGDEGYITQIRAGDMSSTGSVSRSIRGVSITNQPQNRRQYFQTIQLDGFLDEGWEVELYINNRLVDFVIVDQSGTYRFDVDILYGSSRVNLKMYGPNGEIRNEERLISVPYTLIPKQQLEYTLMAGAERHAVEGGLLVASTVHYGILDNVTVGANYETPLGQHDDLNSPMLGTDITYQPFGDLTLAGHFTPDYSSTFDFTFSRPELVSLNGSFSSFNEESPRNVSRRLSSMRLNITKPLRIGGRTMALRYSIALDKYRNQDAITMNYGLNSSFFKFHLSYMGSHKISKYSHQTIKSLSSKVLFTTSWIQWIRPQFRVDYDHERQQVTSYALFLNKRIYKSAQLSLSFVRNVLADVNQVMVSLDLYNSFASFSSKVLTSGDQTSMSQVQRGSIQYDNVDNSVNFQRDNSVGYGTATLRPFSDDNYNGQIDAGEEYLSDTKIDVRGLSGRNRNGSNSYTYNKLRPYYKYQVQIDPTSLDNPLMRPVHENFEVTLNPNMVTSIDIPLAMGSEVSGFIQRQTSQGLSGVGGMKLLFYNLANESLIEVTTFVNGEFYFLGLLPGKYLVYVDPSQLEQYGYRTEPKDIELNVDRADGGEEIDNISFILKPKATPTGN